jgi:hypothetical protein
MFADSHAESEQFCKLALAHYENERECDHDAIFTLLAFPC